MGKIEKAKADDLGAKVSGSARTGHKIELAQESALCRIFGTSDEMQANALLSHCLKPLLVCPEAIEDPAARMARAAELLDSVAAAVCRE